MNKNHFRLVTAMLAALATACGPNAALVRPGPTPGVTPVPWSTATPEPRRATSTAAVPAATPTIVPTAAGMAGAPAPTSVRISVPLYPTAGPQLPIQCQLSGGTVSVGAVGSAALTPVSPETSWITVAAGVAVPGVSLEMRVPSTTFVAGALIPLQLVMRNGSSQDVALFPYASVTPEAGSHSAGQPSPTAGQLVAVLVVDRDSGDALRRTPAGQTRAMFATAQAPFGVGGPAHVHAEAGLTPGSTFGAPRTQVVADVPIQLEPATPSDQLKLEVKADQQQWCVRATDSTGRTPTGPLFISVIGFGRELARAEPAAAGGAMWAGHTQPAPGSPSITQTGPPTLYVWVGGPRHVTARAEVDVH